MRYWERVYLSVPVAAIRTLANDGTLSLDAFARARNDREPWCDAEMRS